MPAVFDQSYVRRLDGPNVKSEAGKRDLAEALRKDIRDFKAAHSCDRMVVIWCASTEIFLEPGPSHQDLDALEAAIDANDASVPPSMLYAYAALQEGVPSSMERPISPWTCRPWRSSPARPACLSPARTSSQGRPC
jgi:myo-inositol-1-phosphate synthase